jgi:hypothetical protein
MNPNHAARIAVCILGILLVVSPLIEGITHDSLKSESKESFADIWTNRDNGSHYRSGEPISIYFKVTTPASHAVITIIDHRPGQTAYLVRTTVYPANKQFSLTKAAVCPADIEVLELKVTIPLYYLPPDIASKYHTNIKLSDTCYFYVDSPCVHSDYDNDGVPSPDDCDDTNPDVHPGAHEVCDEKDNDCDSAIDEGCYTCLVDRDGDSIPECNDCDDEDRFVYPGAEEVCDEKDNDCDGHIDEGCCVCRNDFDLDGACDCIDCNDKDPTIYPGAEEVCDLKDNDCDGYTDEGYCNHAGIWVGRECGSTYKDGELVDVYYEVAAFAQSATVTIVHYPAYGEPVLLVSGHSITPGETYHIQIKAHCPMGLNLLTITASIPGDTAFFGDNCSFYVNDCILRDGDNDGYNSEKSGGTDCDDTDPAVNPGAEEVCDGIDNNCNNFIDEGQDCNYAEIWVDKGCGGYYNDREEVKIYFRVMSSVPYATVTISDYDPGGGVTVLLSDRKIFTQKEYTITGVAVCRGVERLYISATVVIEGKKIELTDDCAFQVINCMNPDSDGDGYKSVLAGGQDCDDANPEINPGADELCDGIDNNCDGVVDTPDNDQDGYIMSECGGTDCDDFDATVYPGAEEVYDGKDNNCDGQKDEGITADQIDTDGDGYPLTEDCNDKNSRIFPGAIEICDDGIDNDCDGYVDCDDEDCAQHDACKGLIDISRILEIVTKYKFFLLGGVLGIIVVAVLTYILLKRRVRLEEEIGKPIEEEPIVPVPEPEKEEGFFARFRRKPKEEEFIEPELPPEVEKEEEGKGFFARFRRKPKEEEFIEPELPPEVEEVEAEELDLETKIGRRKPEEPTVIVEEEPIKEPVTEEIDLEAELIGKEEKPEELAEIDLEKELGFAEEIFEEEELEGKEPGKKELPEEEDKEEELDLEKEFGIEDLFEDNES